MSRYKVFISHSSEDNEFVRQLAHDLREDGISVWLDLDEIDDGERWLREIQKGIEVSAAMLVVMSRNARESEWVERETLYALQLRKPIFIAQTENIPLPLQLVNLQYTDFMADYSDGVDALVAILRPLLNAPPPDTAPHPLPEDVSLDPNEENFFAYIAQMKAGNDYALIARELYRWGQTHGDKIEFGGRFNPAFHVRVSIGAKDVIVYSVLAYLRNPAVQIPFEYLSKYPPYSDYDLRLATLRELDSLLPDDARFKASRANRRPTLQLDYLLGDARRLEQFKQMVVEIMAKLREAHAQPQA